MIRRPEERLTRLERRQRAFVTEVAAVLSGEREDDRDGPHPLTLAERLRLVPGLLDAWFVLTYYTGVRDRMRCPRCTAVGTFKMHGTWLERWVWKDIHVRRWGCKWCGYWITKDGRFQAYPSTKLEPKVWRGPDPEVQREPTPAEVVVQHMGRTWPWRG